MHVPDVKMEPIDRLSPYKLYASTPSPQPPASHSPAYNNNNQQQYSPNPQDYANSNYLYQQQSFNHQQPTNDQFIGMQPLLPQQIPHQLSTNQYNIQPQTQHVFNVPDKPLNIPMTLDSVVNASSSSSKIDSGAINISGLLEIGDSTTYSGDLSGISLSLLDQFQTSGAVESNMQQQQQDQPDALMEPENMTDSFTRFTLNQL